MPAAKDRQRQAIQTSAAALGLIVLGLVSFSNCLDNPLIIDDAIVIEGDPRVRDERFLDLLTGEYWPGGRGNLLYRPLTSVSIAWNWARSTRPRDLRLPNLMLHIGVGLLVLLLAVRVTASAGGATLAAALFVVHPVHTTVLNSVVDRAEIGAAFFGLLAVLLFWPTPPASGTKEPEPRPVMRKAVTVGLATAFFAMALLFKENAVTVFGVVVLADLCRFDGRRGEVRSPGRSGLRRRFLECYLPMLVVIVAYLVLRGVLLGSVTRPVEDIAVVDNIIAHPGYGLADGQSEWLARWGTPVAVFGKALGLLVHPEPLSWDYSYAAIETVKGILDPELILGVAYLGLIVSAMVVSFRRRRLVFFALGFMMVTASVTSNTVVVIGTIFAERFLYLPSVGFCLLVGIAGAAAIRKLGSGRTTTIRAASGLLLLLGVAWTFGLTRQTISRNLDFVSEANLNRVDLKTHPRSCRLLVAVAGVEYDAGDFGAAGGFADRAIELCPEFSRGWQLAGLSLWRSGRFVEALPLLHEASRLGSSASEQVAVAIADIHRTSGDYRSAITVLEAFVERARPDTAAAARNNLAWYLITAEPTALRDPEEALPFARAAVEIEDGQADYIDTLVSVLLALNRRDEARAVLEEAIPTLKAEDPGRPGLLRTLQSLM